MSRTITYIRHFKQVSHKNTDSPVSTASLPNPIPVCEYDLIICSPYLRCRQTAELINHDNKLVVIDVDISEYQGHKNLKALKLTSSTQKYKDIPSHDETWEECANRLDKHMADIKSIKGNILVITHGIVVNYMQEKYEGRSSYVRGRDVPFGKGFSVTTQ